MLRYQNDRKIKEFEDYPPEISEQIESAYRNNEDVMNFEVYIEKVKAKEVIRVKREYMVTFDSMEQCSVRTKYKRGVRRLCKTDQLSLKEFGLDRFDHLVKVVNYNEKCGIVVTTNEIINACIDDIIQNGSNSVTSLQKKQFKIHAERLLSLITDRNEFNNLWTQDFIQNVKPLNYVC